MSSIKDLEPRSLWSEFHEITKVPRPSKREEKMIAYLLEWGKSHGIETKRDEVGNVLMRKGATKGYEDLAPVVLQSHIDMVCEKNNDVQHDFDVDPIDAYIDEGWVKARGTTLGADDGIGVAAQLAVLIDPRVQHGSIECLFTVDEETGLTGAFALQAGFFNGKILLNLDSEDEGELFIGCAGGVDTVGRFGYQVEPSLRDGVALEVSVSGLKGGHSGDDINKGLANAVKVLARLLEGIELTSSAVRIASIEAGNLRNAIAREGKAVVVIAKKDEGQIKREFECLAAALRNEFRTTEPTVNLTLRPTSLPKEVMSKEDTSRLISLLLALPHGVEEMSREMPGLVETSTNLASIRPKEGEAHCLEIATSQRSSVESAMKYIADRVKSTFDLARCASVRSDGYPGWAPNPSSPIVRVAEAAYERLFGVKPIVRAIHAGLECGLFLEKYPELDMVSFGPTLRGVHSPDERLEIASVNKFWDLLLEILKTLPER